MGFFVGRGVLYNNTAAIRATVVKNHGIGRYDIHTQEKHILCNALRKEKVSTKKNCKMKYFLPILDAVAKCLFMIN